MTFHRDPPGRLPTARQTLYSPDTSWLLSNNTILIQAPVRGSHTTTGFQWARDPHRRARGRQRCSHVPNDDMQHPKAAQAADPPQSACHTAHAAGPRETVIPVRLPAERSSARPAAFGAPEVPRGRAHVPGCAWASSRWLRPPQPHENRPSPTFGRLSSLAMVSADPTLSDGKHARHLPRWWRLQWLRAPNSMPDLPSTALRDRATP